MPDDSTVMGVAEDAFRNVHPDEVVQFERFGFVRVDKLDQENIVYFADR